MKKINLLFVFLFFSVLSSLSVCNAQTELKKVIVSKCENPGILSSLNSSQREFFMKKVTSEMSIPFAEYIADYSQTERWPSETGKYWLRPRKIFKDYVLYYVTEFTEPAVDNWPEATYAVLYVPKDENANMPDDYKPENDFFVLANMKNVRILKEKKVFNNNLGYEQFNLMNLSDIIDYTTFYLHNRSGEFININSLGDSAYNCKIQLKGFEKNTVCKAKYNKKYFQALSNIGSNKNEAINIYNNLLANILVKLTDYQMDTSNIRSTDAIIKTNINLYKSPGHLNYPELLSLSLKKSDNNDNSYEISLIIKDPEDEQTEKMWQNAADYAINTLKSEGYTTIREEIARGAGIGFSGDYLENILPNECKWFLFTGNEFANARIQLNDDYKSVVYPMGKPKPYESIWLTNNDTILAESGRYTVLGSGGNGNERWALYLGLKNSEKGRDEYQSKVNAENKIWDDMTMAVTKQLKDLGYTNVEDRGVHLNKDEVVNVGGATYSIEFVVATPVAGLKITTTDPHGNTESFQPEKYINNLYIHAFRFTAKAEGKYTIHFNSSISGSRGYALLFIGSKVN